MAMKTQRPSLSPPTAARTMLPTTRTPQQHPPAVIVAFHRRRLIQSTSSNLLLLTMMVLVASASVPVAPILGGNYVVGDEREKNPRPFTPRFWIEGVEKWGIVERRHVGIQRGGGTVDDDAGRRHQPRIVTPRNEPIISPSLLACDW